MKNRVSIFSPCLVENFLPDVGVFTTKLLKKLGCEVDYKDNQICCGQPFYNAGFAKEAIPFARHFIKLFQREDFIVIPSGSCASMIKNHYFNLPLKENEFKELLKIKKKVFELSEFIFDVLKIKEIPSNFSGSVIYHRNCHTLRELKIEDAPLTLLSSIKGLKLIETSQSFDCCGFGGVFSLKYGKLSEAILERKIDEFCKKNVDGVVTTDAGCILQMKRHFEMRGIKIFHIAEVLYGREIFVSGANNRNGREAGEGHISKNSD